MIFNRLNTCIVDVETKYFRHEEELQSSCLYQVFNKEVICIDKRLNDDDVQVLQFHSIELFYRQLFEFKLPIPEEAVKSMRSNELHFVQFANKLWIGVQVDSSVRFIHVDIENRCLGEDLIDLPELKSIKYFGQCLQIPKFLLK